MVGTSGATLLNNWQMLLFYGKPKSPGDLQKHWGKTIDESPFRLVQDPNPRPRYLCPLTVAALSTQLPANKTAGLCLRYQLTLVKL